MQSSYYRRYRRPKPKRSSFKPFFYFVVFLVFCSLVIKSLVGAIMSLKEEQRDDLVLNLEAGTAQVIWGEQTKEAAQTQLIFEGDAIRTAAGGRVSLQFQNKSRMILDENTSLRFSETNMSGNDDHFIFELHEGRVWLDQLPKESGDFLVEIRSDIMRFEGGAGNYLLSNGPEFEYAYVFDGAHDVSYWDELSGSQIESIRLASGEKSVLDAGEKRALIKRENVVLMELIEEDELSEDEFLQWVRGDLELEEPEEEIEEELEEEPVNEEETPIEEEVPEEEPVVEEEPAEEEVTLEESLSIAIVSPMSPFTLDGDAIALEGRVVSGTASAVQVTWSGDGQPYSLGFFQAGMTDFRYVADAEYKNLVEGENRYTVTAFDENGVASDSITVVIQANFPGEAL